MAFFGPKGYGLEVKDEGNCCAEFEGGGGSVYISAAASKKGSTVDFESVNGTTRKRVSRQNIISQMR